MPAIVPTDPLDITVDDNVFRVLVTGFGPFANYTENPSWLAVKRLHNLIIDAPSEPIVVDEKVVLTEPKAPGSVSRQIHITTLKVPVTYEAILSTVPGLHARPPQLPASDGELPSSLPPPERGYDLIFHVGVAGRGPLRMERLGHKYGYNMKDASGKLAPLVRVSPQNPGRVPGEPSEAERRERERLSSGMVEGFGDNGELPPTRGFGKGYESFFEELHTDLDVEKIVQYLKDVGIEIYSSMDAGHYLCDFIYYASLAENRRTTLRHDKNKSSKVLFLHCPPVNQPLSTEEVTEAVKQVIVWICSHL